MILKNNNEVSLKNVQVKCYERAKAWIFMTISKIAEPQIWNKSFHVEKGQSYHKDEKCK